MSPSPRQTSPGSALAAAFSRLLSRPDATGDDDPRHHAGGDQTLARAEAAAAALPPLLVQAERIASTVLQGAHGRRRVGAGDQFWQFRRYGPGDPVPMIDWRQTAKRQRAYIRQREWSAAQTITLWCAAGPGMAWRSAPTLPTKQDHARLLTLGLASLLLRGGERVGLLAPAEAPATGHATLHRLAAALCDQDDTPLPPPVSAPRHGTVVLIGDFLSPLPAIASLLRGLADADVRGHLVQILDPAEETFPYQGRIRFLDPASPDAHAAVLAPRCEDLRQPYLDRFAAHRAGLRDLCRRQGWTFSLHHTDRPLVTALLALHQGLSLPPQHNGGI